MTSVSQQVLRKTSIFTFLLICFLQYTYILKDLYVDIRGRGEKSQSLKKNFRCADHRYINHVPCRYAVHNRGTIHVQAARIESCRTVRTGCAPCSPETLRCPPSPASTPEGSTYCQPLRPRELTWLSFKGCRSYTKSRAPLRLGTFVGAQLGQIVPQIPGERNHLPACITPPDSSSPKHPRYPKKLSRLQELLSLSTEK